jgi:hypothetical protein
MRIAAVLPYGLMLSAWGIAMDARAQEREATVEPLTKSSHAIDTRPTVRFMDRPVSLNLVLGMATPAGEVGGLVECSVAPWIALGIGIGASFSGPQYGAMLRLRTLRWEKAAAHALDFVVAGSGGAYEPLYVSSDDPREYTTTVAFWIQPSVEYELLAGTGFRFTAGVGAAIRAATSAETCASQAGVRCSAVHVPSAIPTVSTSFGFGI